MEQEFYSLLTSATTHEEAKGIATRLVEKRLASGLQVHDGAPCYYWWQGKMVEKVYYTISGFTIGGHREKIVAEIRALHTDETPTITFTKIDGSYPQFLEWIRESTAL